MYQIGKHKWVEMELQQQQLFNFFCFLLINLVTVVLIAYLTDGKLLLLLFLLNQMIVTKRVLQTLFNVTTGITYITGTTFKIVLCIL